MKSTKSFNNISSKLLKEVEAAKPKRGETVTFQMLNGVPNPEPDLNERSKQPVLYGKVQIPTNFRIYDPYQKNESGEEVGGYVDVGCVDVWNGDTPVRFKLFVRGMGEYSFFEGKFSLSGDSISDMELFEILYLSNYREGNQNRDKSVTPLFKIVDQKIENTAIVNKFNVLKTALDYVNSITVDKAKSILSSLNKVYTDEAVIMAQVKELATTEPQTFIKIYESKETVIKATLNDAMNGGALVHDVKTGEVKVGNVLITTIKAGNQEELVGMLASWISQADNGTDILNTIKGQTAKAAAV